MDFLTPSFLQKLLLAPSFSPTQLKFYGKISDAYRGCQGHASSLLFEKEDVLAYVRGRMPATIASIHAVLKELKEQYPAILSAKSFLDLGSGPGSFLWALLSMGMEMEAGVLWEGNSFFQEFLTHALKEGKKTHLWLENVKLFQETLLSPGAWQKLKDPFDCVSLSYVLSEIQEEQQTFLLEEAWRKTKSLLILIEPGTPFGFANILRARKFLRQRGGGILAPCVHQNECPLEGAQDWCHFKVRLKRSFEHRHIKAASCDYEDEKYSYLLVSKEGERAPSQFSRILKNPLKRSGHMLLDVCAEDGEKRITVSKRTPSLYRQAQKKKWGDVWDNLKDPS